MMLKLSLNWNLRTMEIVRIILIKLLIMVAETGGLLDVLLLG